MRLFYVYTRREMKVLKEKLVNKHLEKKSLKKCGFTTKRNNFSTNYQEKLDDCQEMVCASTARHWKTLEITGR